jgi:hypothetical protein
MWTDVSGKRVIPIFSVDNGPSKKPECRRWPGTYGARRYIPEEGSIYCYRCENLESQQISERSNTVGSAEGNTCKESLPEVAIQGLLQPAEANLGYFSLWQSGLLLLNASCLFWYLLSCEQNLSFLILTSGLSDIRINCNRITESFVIVNIMFRVSF